MAPPTLSTTAAAYAHSARRQPGIGAWLEPKLCGVGRRGRHGLGTQLSGASPGSMGRCCAGDRSPATTLLETMSTAPAAVTATARRREVFTESVFGSRRYPHAPIRPSRPARGNGPASCQEGLGPTGMRRGCRPANQLTRRSRTSHPEESRASYR